MCIFECAAFITMGEWWNIFGTTIAWTIIFFIWKEHICGPESEGDAQNYQNVVDYKIVVGTTGELNYSNGWHQFEVTNVRGGKHPHYVVYAAHPNWNEWLTLDSNRMKWDKSGFAGGGIRNLNFPGGADFNVGHRTQCLYTLNGKYYACRIESANPDGTYNVIWDDGDTKDRRNHPEHHFKSLGNQQHNNAVELQVGGEDAVALCLYTNGVYHITENGYKKIHNDGWGDARGICYCGYNRAICLYKKGVYSIDTRTGNWQKLTDDSWDGARGFCYVGNNRAVCLYTNAIYDLDTNNGNWTKLAGSSWNEARGFCYIGNNRAICVSKNGVHKINTLDGSHEQINGENWNDTTGLCYIENDTCMCLYKKHVYTIDCNTGGWKKLHEDGWPNVRGLVYVGNNRALCVYSDALYLIDTTSGGWRTINKEGWNDARGVIWLNQLDYLYNNYETPAAIPISVLPNAPPSYSNPAPYSPDADMFAPPSAYSQPSATGGITAELRELTDMKKEGLLSDAEFSAAKARILGLHSSQAIQPSAPPAYSTGTQMEGEAPPTYYDAV